MYVTSMSNIGISNVHSQEHVTRGYPEALLGNVFSKATFLGAGLMAIISGEVCKSIFACGFLAQPQNMGLG